MKNKVPTLKNILYYLFITGLSAGLLGLLIIIALFGYFFLTIPDPSIVGSRQVSQSTKIYDSTGEKVLYDVHGEEKRTIISFEDIPQIIRNATIAAEDSEFYTHKGIDFNGFLRAIYKNLTSLSFSQGGSTITQQLIKNTLLDNEKTVTRKIKEAILSIQIEKRFSKDKILEMYLNQIPYGSNIYGVEAASQTFFSKSTKELTLAQAALIAGIPKAPTYYSPYGKNKAELLKRKDYILGQMKNLKMISEKEYNDAINEKLEFAPKTEILLAPHFVIMVRDYLIKKYGEELAQNGGLRVITTLDSDLQKYAEEAVEKYGDINEKKYKAKNAALTAVNPKDGSVLAMVGSRDYFNVEREGNFNVATAKRQPGSSFKPFAYATAVSKGIPDNTILFDVQTEFNPSCNASGFEKKDKYGLDCYNPQNFNGTFSGPVTLREALQRSLNIPAVKTLYIAGIDDTIKTAQSMGITTLNSPSSYGLSLVLGGAEVKLIDIVSAYGVFANKGVKNKTHFINKITDRDGNVLEEFKVESERAIPENVANIMNDILSDNNARAAVFGFNNNLYFPDRKVAAKTGTTQENRDGWVIGYTPTIAAGVWTGNNDNTSMTREGAGLSAAGPMWHYFMQKAFTKVKNENFAQPEFITSEKPMLNGSYIGYNGIHNILQYVTRGDPSGAEPNNPSFDPQYTNWETAVQLWLQQHGITQPVIQQTIEPLPTPTPTPTI